MRRDLLPDPDGGLRSLAPELIRIVEALARVQEERNHAAGSQMPARMAFGAAAQSPDFPEFGIPKLPGKPAIKTDFLAADFAQTPGK